MSLKVGVIGASGYAGAELVRLLLRHPYVTLSAISSNQYTGQPLSSLYPGFQDVCDLVFVDSDTVIEQSDCVFASLPHGHSEAIAAKCIQAGKRFIDLGADFRLKDKDIYYQWYGVPFLDEDLHAQAVYGISELHRDQIKDAQLIGNPGCYPTSIELALYPVLKEGLVNTDSIIFGIRTPRKSLIVRWSGVCIPANHIIGRFSHNIFSISLLEYFFCV